MVEIAVRWQLNRHVDAVVAAKMGNVVAATSSLNGSDWDGQVLGLTSDGTTEADFLVGVFVKLGLEPRSFSSFPTENIDVDCSPGCSLGRMRNIRPLLIWRRSFHCCM